MDFDIDNFSEDYDSIRENLAKSDSEINDLIHVLEFVSLDAVQMIKTASKLKIKLKDRRELKERMAYYNSVRDCLLPAIIKVNKAKEKAITRVDRYKSESISSANKYGIK